MKLLVASIFALSLLGAGAANSGGIGIGAHVGPVHLGVGAHAGSHDRSYHRGHRHCISWGGHGHYRHCHRWGR